MMLNRTLAALILVVGVALPCAAQAPCRRNLESGFSYCPPDGWAIRQSLDDKFKTFLGPSSNILTPNINARDEDDQGSLADHVATSIKYIMANFQASGMTAVKLLDQTEFVTASGLRGIKVAFHVENSSKGLLGRTYQYYFNGRGNQKLVFTGTVVELERNTFEAVFDRAMKTFQIDK